MPGDKKQEKKPSATTSAAVASKAKLKPRMQHSPQNLVLLLRKESTKCPHLESSTIPVILQLSTTLRFLATGAFQGVIGIDLIFFMVNLLQFNNSFLAKDVDVSSFKTVCMSADEIQNSKAHFFNKFHVPGVIGCVDSTHVKMNKPSEDESLFLNRKGSFSVNAMISVLWMHADLADNYSNGNKNSWLLGDSGYGLEPFLITPYKNVTIGTLEHKINQKHASARNIIEEQLGAYNVEYEDIITTNENDENYDEDVEEISGRDMFNVAQRIRNNIAAQLN
ncbi:putative nuclease HARBI1 [Lucilia cuprina]|nr:putative nuclease HARBI1 [Lucilia cuprina]